MAQNPGFVKDNNMTPVRVKSENVTVEKEPKCHETSECSPSSRQNSGDHEDFSLKIKLYGNVYDCGTMGKESIYEMIVRVLGEVDHGHKPIVSRMLFKTLLDDCHLNLGLPTGALDRDVTYECIFMGNSKINTTDFVRAYDVTQFHENWNMNKFDVKFDSKVNVGYIQTLQNVSKLRVHFFPDETLYEALCRDGRFEKSTKGDLVIRSCDFITVDGKDSVLLSNKAKQYAGQCFEPKKRNKENQTLPVNVPPLKMPGRVAFNVSSTVKEDEPVTPIKSSGKTPQPVFQPSASSTPATGSQVRKLQSFDDLKSYIEKDVGLKLEPEGNEKRERQRKKKIETFLKEHCQNFALEFPHTFSLSNLKTFVKLEFAIGAVIAVNVSEVEHCSGTCFRIGKKFVLTNYHVFEIMYKFAGGKLGNCYVDFDYKGTEEGHAVNFIDIPPLFSSGPKELDYAIMELDTMCGLPASLTDLGYSIAPPSKQLQAGENLSLIGHPNGMEKMVNMSCPIKPKEQIEAHLNLAVHVLVENEFYFHHDLISKAWNNPNIALYDVSNFFWGSSGSPGILINEKLIIVLHFHGILLNGTHVLEQGVLMSSIVQDVSKKLEGDNGKSKLTIDDIFGEGTEADFQPPPHSMETD